MLVIICAPTFTWCFGILGRGESPDQERGTGADSFEGITGPGTICIPWVTKTNAEGTNHIEHGVEAGDILGFIATQVYKLHPH